MGEFPQIRGWPLVEVDYPPVVAVGEMTVVYDEVRRLLARGEPFALVHHTTSTLDAKTRRYVAERLRENALLSRTLIKGEAIVSASPIVRGVLTALQWIFPHPHPARAFEDAETARQWCRAMLGEAHSRAS